MKKLITGLCVLTVCAMSALAGMDTVVYGFSAATGTTTQTKAYVVRGTIESIYVDITATTTCTVSVADSYGTVFSKSAIVADAQYFPRVAGQTTAGADLTQIYTGSSGEVFTATATFGGIGGCQKIAVAGDVTVTVVHAIAAATTNTATVTLIVDK